MSKPRVSVLLPAYNTERTVRLAVSSILRQSYSDFEIIAVDDGSTDSTPAILEEMASIDSRLQVLRMPHAGLISALNEGISHCRGELIARMDADDICHPDRLRLQVDLMDTHPEVSVCGCLVRSVPRSRVKAGFAKYEEWLNSLVTHAEIARDMFVESPLAHPSVVMRKQDLVEIGGYRDMGWPEDYDLWLRLFMAGKRFEKVPRLLLYWREWENRLTFTDSRYSLENFMRLKAHFLAQMVSRLSRPVVIWGAGMTGRRLGKHLMRSGVQPVAVVDIDPRKVGRKMRGVPIIWPEELTRYPDAFVLVAVGSSEARELIRRRLEKLNRTECRDFLCTS
jgi:glycosyltransferase involved in cell wall biosynthesis